MGVKGVQQRQTLGVDYRGVRTKRRSTGELVHYAELKHDGKVYRSQRFPNLREAARAYDSLAIRIIGNEAILNFPKTLEVANG